MNATKKNIGAFVAAGLAALCWMFAAACGASSNSVGSDGDVSDGDTVDESESASDGDAIAEEEPALEGDAESAADGDVAPEEEANADGDLETETAEGDEAEPDAVEESESIETNALFSRPSDGTGNIIKSSWVDPNGTDSDMYAYDSFELAADASITKVSWQGGYFAPANYGKATNFTVTFYASLAGGSQPQVVNPQLPETYLAMYDVQGNAGETVAATISGTTIYNYEYVLPTPFQASANTKYWIRIEASMTTFPGWGITSGLGSGADGQYYNFSVLSASFRMIATGDLAFTLQ
jgi:hypothetical protein